jgi:Transposase DDE domain
MRETPFDSENLLLSQQKKGVFLMSYDIVATQAESATVPVKEQMERLLTSVLIQAAPQEERDSKRGRGRPADLCLEHAWLALLLGMLEHSDGLARVWRTMVSGPVGPFPMLNVTYEAVRSRLLKAGTAPLWPFFLQIRAALQQWQEQQQVSALPLARFATQVVALDETSLDELKRLTADLREVPDKDPHLRPGKLAGLFDLRSQQWVRLQFRADVPAGCNVGIWTLLSGLPRGSLILEDLGYFSFPWFDFLTEQGYSWISRLKAKTSYIVQQVFYEDPDTGMFDGLVWLGAYRADRAANVVRLVQFKVKGVTYQYITNVLDPAVLSMLEIAQLYARRWDIELAFKVLKREVGLALWWGANPELVLIQLWLALILAQVLHALQLAIAVAADVEPFDVSMHLLVEQVGKSRMTGGPLVQLLAERGRFLGLIRPSSRRQVLVPALKPECIRSHFQGAPPPRSARYAGRNGHGPRKPFSPRLRTHLLL